MANTDNLQAPWKPGQSGNPNGRPKNRVPEHLTRIMGKQKAKKFYALSACEVDDWEGAVLTMTAEQLADLTMWEECPAYPKALAIAILRDMKTGKTFTIDKLRERQYGKAVQRVELTGRDGVSLMQPQILTPKEAKEMLNQLESDF